MYSYHPTLTKIPFVWAYIITFLFFVIFILLNALLLRPEEVTTDPHDYQVRYVIEPGFLYFCLLIILVLMPSSL